MVSTFSFLLVPRNAMTRFGQPHRLSRILLALWVADMFVSLLGWPHLMAAVQLKMSQLPLVAQGAGPGLAVATIIMMSLIRLVALALVALLFFFASHAQGGDGTLHDMACAVAVASFPLLFGRLVRALVEFGGGDAAHSSWLFAPLAAITGLPRLLQAVSPFDLWAMLVAMFVLPPALGLTRKTGLWSTLGLSLLLCLFIARLRILGPN